MSIYSFYNPTEPNIDFVFGIFGSSGLLPANFSFKTFSIYARGLLSSGTISSGAIHAQSKCFCVAVGNLLPI